MEKLTPIIKDSFLQFAGAVLQSRALSDTRDNLKPSTRQILYCLYTDNFIHNKPFQKTLKAIGSCFRMYIHGDASAEGVIMRSAQPFAMRYPLVEAQGSYGTLLSSGSWAAPRYTEARLSPLCDYLFADIKKDVIEEWRDNYDNTEQYPMVLPSKGFFNIVNGNYGIGVGAASSIPQYNLRELNAALIKLLWNPDISFDEIYCPPDFATGALLLNASEVKESHRNGQGFACKLRSVIEWDEKDRCLIVREIPYMIYTETICKELETIINGESNPGIDRFNDLTGQAPLIKIYLTKTANVTKVLQYLYKSTSLQTHYGVNFTMLENGRYPKVFGWKEILQSHINHEITVYTRGFEFDLEKLKARIHILEGLLKAIDQMDKVIDTIKRSSSVQDAIASLKALLIIDDIQAKAILDIKLAKLPRLEVAKLEEERVSLLKNKEHIETILADETLLKKEIEKGLVEVATKFGDDRRTHIQNEAAPDEEIKDYQVSLSNQNNLHIQETSSFYVQRRGGVGNKLKLNNGEVILSSIKVKSNSTLLLFTKDGSYYNKKVNEFEQGLNRLELNICAITSIGPEEGAARSVLFITKEGMLKKSSIEEYNIVRAGLKKAITLNDGDSIVSVLFTAAPRLGIGTSLGNYLIIGLMDVNMVGRIAKGVHAIKLNPDDTVSCAHAIDDNVKELLCVSANGFIKRLDINDFPIQGRNTKGCNIQKHQEGDTLVDVYPLSTQSQILVVSRTSCIRLNVADFLLLNKGAAGGKSIKLAENDSVITLLEA